MPWRRQTSATVTSGFSVSVARPCSSLKRRRFDRPSTACRVKRYLRRATIASSFHRPIEALAPIA
jgi:hypothetical protein